MKEQSIWKFELSNSDTQNISMPKGAEILTAQVQNGTPYIWALVDTIAETEIRTIEIFGTGSPILSDMGTSRKYISTIQLLDGRFIVHVFEYTGI